MKMGWRGVGLALTLGAGCAPLTFSNEADVDFRAYPRVLVEVGGPDGSRRQHDYLADELRVHSGFRQIARSSSEATDARLWVELSAHSNHEEEDIIVDILFGTEDEVPAYSAYVSYQLEAAEGGLIDAGETFAEGSDYFGAMESGLDLVVLHYLRPYRL